MLHWRSGAWNLCTLRASSVSKSWYKLSSSLSKFCMPLMRFSRL